MHNVDAILLRPLNLQHTSPRMFDKRAEWRSLLIIASNESPSNVGPAIEPLIAAQGRMNVCMTARIQDCTKHRSIDMASSLIAEWDSYVLGHIVRHAEQPINKCSNNERFHMQHLFGSCILIHMTVFACPVQSRTCMIVMPVTALQISEGTGESACHP
jgi:hypothetical protein